MVEQLDVVFDVESSQDAAAPNDEMVISQLRLLIVCSLFLSTIQNGSQGKDEGPEAVNFLEILLSRCLQYGV